MQSLASIKSTALQLTKTAIHSDVKLLAELVLSLADSFEQTENKAKQAYAEANRIKSQLKKIERGTA